ncbi:MAG: BamA/TamA family outer membrane protein [Candidatus Omnitrophica bacterium]|nr:BamA/TamA family outer membrane protein [Candidatus Omnitrophota bacterium]
MIKKKYSYLLVFLLTLTTLLYGSPRVSFAQSEDDSAEIKALIEEMRSLRQKVSEIDALKQKLTELENKVDIQQRVIEQQRSVLEKVEGLPEIKKALAPPEPKILIKKFVLNEVNLFSPEDFKPILKKYYDRELTMTDLKNIAEQITQYYRSKGYINTVAYVPAQEIVDNTAEFRIVEGRVGDIKVEGGEYYKAKTIEPKVLIEKGQALNYEELNENLRRINKQPDRTVEAFLQPGKEEGTSDILLKTKDERPWHINMDYTNRGTKYTTTNRFGIGFTHNNLLGHNDILSTKFRIGEDSDIYSFSGDYNIPINRYDTRLGAYGAFSNAEIGDQFSVLNPEGKAAVYGIYLSHPLINEDFDNFTLESNVIAGFDSISIWNNILGNESSHDELRVAKLGISFDEKDSAGRTFLSENIRVGISDFLGSMETHSEESSRLDANSEFIKNTGSLTRITRLPMSSYLVNRVNYQITTDPLVSSEQFVIGGVDSVRGYPENEYFGDYGITASFELRTPAFLLPSFMRSAPKEDGASKLIDTLQFIYFVDLGEASLKSPRVGEDADAYLVGAGVGLRFNMINNLSGRLDWGFPMNTEPSDDSSSTLHIGLGYEW